MQLKVCRLTYREAHFQKVFFIRNLLNSAQRISRIETKLTFGDVTCFFNLTKQCVAFF